MDERRSSNPGDVGSSPARGAMIIVANMFFLFVDFMLLGILFFIVAANPTKQVVFIYTLYYGLLMWGSHYYTGRLALKAFGRYRPDESKPGLINYWFEKFMQYYSGRRVG